MSGPLTRKGEMEPNPVMTDHHIRVPVDRLAARGMFGGEKYEYAPNLGHEVEYRAMPPIAVPPVGVPDLRKMRCGRFRVVGWSRDYAKRWVVRCDCGAYAMRSTKAVRNPANADDRCLQCRQLLYLRRKEAMDKRGHWPTNREVDC